MRSAVNAEATVPPGAVRTTTFAVLAKQLSREWRPRQDSNLRPAA